jgi:hypothetical protein
VYGRRVTIAVALSLLALHAPPPANVTIVEQRCPGASPAMETSCAVLASNVIYLDPVMRTNGQRQWRFALAHELGHMWDYQHLTDDARQRFAQMVGQPGADWLTGEATSMPQIFGQIPPIEVFADAYAFCAMGANYRRWARFGDHYTAQYYFETIPTRAVAATCWLLHHPPIP